MVPDRGMLARAIERQISRIAIVLTRRDDNDNSVILCYRYETPEARGSGEYAY